MHPFLAPQFEVRWSTLVPEAIEADIRHALSLAAERIKTISETSLDELTYENTFGALEAATEELDSGWGRLSHLDSVRDEPKQREEMKKMLPEVSDFYASIPLNDKLWTVIKAFGESPAVAKLDSVRRRFVEETMHGFQQSGADLPEDQKKRIAEIEAELSKITKEYSENVLDATNAWELVIEEEALLTGLPASAKAAAFANAKAKGVATDENPAWRFTLQAPSMIPVMQFADNEALRKQVWEASTTVGSKAPQDNSELVWKILSLRNEKAQILGHKNFADLVLQRRMAKDGKTALHFVEDLQPRVAPFLQAEYRQLIDYKASKQGGEKLDLQPWEYAYWSEKQRKEHFDLDDEDLRPYFPVDQVMSGMFELATRLFDITITQREAAFYEPGQRPANAGDLPEVWHDECTFYDLHDTKTGEHFGSFYADWHPRESKRGGAWMNCLETGLPGSPDHARKPHLGLIIGNMTPPIDGKTALLTHNEVETIFHEFGHLLHGLLSNVPVKGLAGTNVPWDFVELPSQIMENFCWDRESLNFFARHHETGDPIPQALFDRMIAARNYGSAYAFMRQLAFGKLDLELHINLAKYEGRNLDEVDHEILADYTLPLLTKSPTMVRRFGHLFSSPTGYAAGYYSYKWSEVLDADAFTRFQDDGVISNDVGRAFRENILSKGNSAPVDELFRNFMGRDTELDALLVRSGLVAAEV